MCGIAGIWTKNPSLLDQDQRLQMLNQLRHRGPDAQRLDVLQDGGLVLLHTRLSVIDLSSAGHQPMWNEDHSISLVYNGEIYNFKELRRELDNAGHHFRSNTDSEVILHGYEEWGTKVVHRLNGMFAFAIWDGKKRRLWMARDRLGKKPLYYHFDPETGTLVFASEIKSILVCPWLERRVSPHALHCYLSLGYVPSPHTMFAGIFKLPAAHLLNFDGEKISIQRYWNIETLGSLHLQEAEITRNIRELVTQAISRRLVSDVPLGAFLSGGVDSSIVVGVMSTLLKQPVRTFSAAYDVGPHSSKYNVDADAAETVARHFKTRHTRLTIPMGKNLFKVLREVVLQADEPHGNPTLIATYLLAKEVKRHGITVILTGDGSDECFGGYSRYWSDRQVDMLRLIPRNLRQAMIKLLGEDGKAYKLKKGLLKADTLPGSSMRYLCWWEQFGEEERRHILLPEWHEGIKTPKLILEEALSHIKHGNSQDTLRYADLVFWIAEESNMRIDKMCMAHALEARAPFLDYEVVEYALGIPYSKLANRRSGKMLLKKSFADLLPSIALSRPKWGWISPATIWVNDIFWDAVCESLSALTDTGIFQYELTNILHKYRQVQAHKLWYLMVFAVWYDEYIESLGLSF